MKKMRWVILDRDGVINEDSDDYIKSPEEWRPILGSLEAIAKLHQSGFQIAVLTNQSGLTRGFFSLADLKMIHAKMLSQVEAAGGKIDAIYFCPHGPEDACECRKPKAGMFHQFSREHNVNLNGIPAVGDSLRDLQAAESVSAEAILVETGKGQHTLKRNPNLDIQSFTDLHEAVQYILFTHGER